MMNRINIKNTFEELKKKIKKCFETILMPTIVKLEILI